MKTKHIAITLYFPPFQNLVVKVDYEGAENEAEDNLSLIGAIHKAITKAEEESLTSIEHEFTVIDSDIAEQLSEYEWGEHEFLKEAIEVVKKEREEGLAMTNTKYIAVTISTGIKGEDYNAIIPITCIPTGDPVIDEENLKREVQRFKDSLNFQYDVLESAEIAEMLSNHMYWGEHENLKDYIEDLMSEEEEDWDD